MRAVKISGLIIFVAGFFLFNASSFWASYQLTPEILKAKISDGKKLELFTQHASEFLGKSFSSNYRFVTALTDVFNKANEQHLERYGITDADIQ